MRQNVLPHRQRLVIRDVCSSADTCVAAIDDIATARLTVAFYQYAVEIFRSPLGLRQIQLERLHFRHARQWNAFVEEWHGQVLAVGDRPEAPE